MRDKGYGMVMIFGYGYDFSVSTNDSEYLNLLLIEFINYYKETISVII